jgi:hypothetical protein
VGPVGGGIVENTKHLCGIGMALDLKLTTISSFQYLDVDLLFATRHRKGAQNMLS